MIETLSNIFGNILNISKADAEMDLYGNVKWDVYYYRASQQAFGLKSVPLLWKQMQKEDNSIPNQKCSTSVFVKLFICITPLFSNDFV